MLINQLKEIISTALANSYTQTENLNIFDKFSKEEIYDMIHNIAISLPKYNDTVADTIQVRVLDAIPEVLREDAIANEIKALLRIHLGNRNTKEYRARLIALLCIDFRNNFPDDSITKELEEIVKFYTSYIIYNSEDLQVEVANNHVTAQTQILGNYYLRVDEVGNLIPTIQTIKEFKHYLFNH